MRRWMGPASTQYPAAVRRADGAAVPVPSMTSCISARPQIDDPLEGQSIGRGEPDEIDPLGDGRSVAGGPVPGKVGVAGTAADRPTILAGRKLGIEAAAGHQVLH